jgi:hypothetical protein
VDDDACETFRWPWPVSSGRSGLDRTGIAPMFGLKLIA